VPSARSSSARRVTRPHRRQNRVAADLGEPVVSGNPAQQVGVDSMRGSAAPPRHLSGRLAAARAAPGHPVPVRREPDPEGAAAPAARAVHGRGAATLGCFRCAAGPPDPVAGGDDRHPRDDPPLPPARAAESASVPGFSCQSGCQRSKASAPTVSRTKRWPSLPIPHDDELRASEPEHLGATRGDDRDVD
jgi:hypothetical protein